MSNISLYIFYGLTIITLATCSTIIILGICECILLRKKRQTARIIPITPQDQRQITYTYNPEFIEFITL